MTLDGAEETIPRRTPERRAVVGLLTAEIAPVEVDREELQRQGQGRDAVEPRVGARHAAVARPVDPSNHC